MEKLILGQDDKPLLMDIQDENGAPVNFADLIDVEVVLAVNKIKVATYRKVPGDDEFEVLPVDGYQASCKILLTSAQQADWNTGLLQGEMTLVSDEPDFPEGRRTTQTFDLYYCINQL
jgi:hypothetical protein